MIFNFFEADCGAGKTYALGFEVERIVSEGFHVLYCLPTKQVIEQVKADLKSRFPKLDVDAIYRKDERGSVGRIKKCFRNETVAPDVLLITTAAFERLEGLHKPEDWQLICDEVPPATRFFSINVPKTHKIITGNITTSDWINDPTKKYHLVKSKNKKLRLIAKNAKRDAVYDQFSEPARHIDFPYFDVIMKKSTYSALLTPAAGRSVKFACLGVLKPDIFTQFASVLIAGASVTSSILYKELSNVWGVQFQEATHLKSYLQYQKHQNTDLIDIYYASDRDFSIRYAQKFDNMKILSERALSLMGTDNFIWIDNGRNPNPTDYSKNGVEISSYPHGINAYKDYTAFVSLAAFNLDNSHLEFLKDVCGINYDEARDAIHNEMHYQAVCRTAIRDPGNTNRIKVFVADLSTAEFLKGRFPQATLTKLDIKLDGDEEVNKGGRPAIYESAADRQRSYNARKADRKRESAAKLAAMTTAAPLPHQIGGGLDDKTSAAKLSILRYLADPTEYYCDETTILNSSNVTQFYASVFKDLTNNKSSNNLVGYTLSDIEDLLVALSSRTISSKRNNFAFCPAFFDGGIRKKDNIVGCGSFFLDHDGGLFTPQDIKNMFSGIRFTIYASYSDTIEKRKFRVFIPLKGYVSAEDFIHVCDYIKNLIKDYAYQNRIPSTDDNTHYGFDERGFNPSQLMFAPCKPANASSYCKVHRGKSRSILNPIPIIEKQLILSLEASRAATKSTAPTSDLRNDARAHAAIEHWHSVCQDVGCGNDNFFLLGKELYCSGYDRPEAQMTLEREAAHARNPDERRRQIRSILNSCDSFRKKLGRTA